ncbi:hypothetical protein [Xylanimonas protaetiae]|uniref:Uncharacterized protein n=1 Tax=Xylanimonas protaetiae TaxID=2509457 RepID=A0A4V0YG52_9MICO|nr:hypothetical protein [Xylanimonas protaetiae]QAY70001.1 hypothetical protein ET471_08125 [Xylanimonas protaetiae]
MAATVVLPADPDVKHETATHAQVKDGHLHLYRGNPTSDLAAYAVAIYAPNAWISVTVEKNPRT